jgi:hypothetical protein
MGSGTAAARGQASDQVLTSSQRAVERKELAIARRTEGGRSSEQR